MVLENPPGQRELIVAAIADPHHLRFSKVRLRHVLLRALLAPLCSWTELANPSQGYSLVLAVPVKLQDLLAANLRFLQRQDRVHLERMIIVLDQPASSELRDSADQITRRFADLPLQFLHFNPIQTWVLDALGWGWAYGWLSWCLGLAACHSRYLMIHDLDLLTLSPDFLEKRYRTMREGQLQYLGMEYFQWNSVVREDRVMPSNQLMVEAPFVRKQFEPIDLFSRIVPHRGRWVHFDLTQHMQTCCGQSQVLPFAFMDMVHPAQMISHYTALLNRKNYQPYPRSSLLLIPYYLMLAEKPEAMHRLLQSMTRHQGRKTLRLLGRALDISASKRKDIETLAEMAYQVEKASLGYVRSEVREYFERLADFVEPSTVPLRQAA